MKFDMKFTFRAILAALTRSKWWLQRPLVLPGAKPKVPYEGLESQQLAAWCSRCNVSGTDFSSFPQG
jgi:myo-inositol catabolism protein IolC